MAPGAAAPEKERRRKRVCVMDASGRVGCTLVQRLLQRGYTVHAAIHPSAPQAWIGDRVKYPEGIPLSCEEDKKRLRIFQSDPLDYPSIVDALKGCSALFYCFEPPPDHPIYDEFIGEVEVRAAHNVVEACARTDSIEKVVFTSSATAVIWGDGRNSQSHSQSRSPLDERNWTDVSFCKKYKLWHGLSKTVAEKTAWALAMDRGLNMVSVNGGLLVAPHCPRDDDGDRMTATNPYLKGAAEMYEEGVLVTVDLRYLVDAHICIMENESSYGRYLCFNKVVDSDTAALELALMLFPSSLASSLPPHQTLSSEERRVSRQRISNKKLNQLMKDFESRRALSP